jgi:hypothetical protein
MKTTTNLVLTGILATLFSSIGNAQIVPGDIIYSNAFNGGTNTINGTAPTVANNIAGGTNTALWICTATNYTVGTNAFVTNFTMFANGTLFTNAGSAVLPFKPQAGAIYFLTASVYLPAANNWVGLGFCQTATQGTNGTSERFTDANVKGGPWEDIREGNSINFFGGPETSLGSAGADVEPTVGTYTLTIILNTLGAKWVTGAFINGVLEGTNVAGSTQLGTNIVYGSNPAIGYFGLTQQAITAGDAVQWNYIALSTALWPMITQPPTPQAIPVGSPYTNTVGAIADTNGGPLYYQWYTNGVLMTGATNSTLILNPTIAGEAGTNYYVVVTNTYGAVTSGAVSLTLFVTNPPVFSEIFPVNYTNTMTLYGGTNVGGTNYAGSTPTFSVLAVGAEPIFYQWFTNGVAVSGATNTSFTLTNCQMNSPTNFACMATNNYGRTNTAWSVTYLPTTVAPYPQAVLTAQPVAYWRLNEPDDNLGDGNPGAICNDYQSGNNGIYTNVNLGQQGYNSMTDPVETSALFGESGLSLYYSYAGQIQGVDFAAASGLNAEFTVEAWANGYPNAQISGSTLITEGIYGFNDEFALNMDASSPHHYEFYVRSANGTVYTADSAFAPDGNWHHLAGVCDEANGQVSLYIDGQLAASSSIPPNSGVYEADMPLSIGAGIQGAATNYTLQFRGYIDDVAAYKYALSSHEVTAQYVAAGEPPSVVQIPPTSVTIGAGATLVLPATFIGTPPLGYYWTDVNANTNVTAGTTTNILLNATLTVADVASNWNGDSLELTVTNAYGSISYYVYLNVVGGPPQIVTDVQTSFVALVGGVASNSVTVIGAFPLYYQWQFNGTNLPESGELSGTQSNIFLNITNAQGSNSGGYQVIVSNNYGSVTSSVATLAVVGIQPIGFDGTGPGWTTNQLGTESTPFITDGVLTLTDGGGSEARSFFFNYPQYIGAFEAAFTYRASGTADGATFCLQNDPRGASALGSTGGALGVNTNSGGTVHNITPSVELELNIYSANAVGGIGYSFNTNGSIGPTTSPGSVNIKSDDPIGITLYYAQGQLSLTFTDAVAASSFSTNLAVGNLTQILGSNTAYIGFTGADGGSTSIQTISNFTFVSIPTAAIQLSGANAVISWPGEIAGYGLQQNANLATTNWVNVTNQTTLTNNLYETIVPVGGSDQFYRLILQP